MRRYHVKVVCTTDDPVDSLEYHIKTRESGFEIKMLPIWRPDKAMVVEVPADFRAYVEKLAEVSGVTISGFDDLVAGWWFLDQKNGMEKQMNALSVLGLLSRFVGMLTDSRSFLSYPRHEYFRRTLCNLIGHDVENGEIPASEMERVNQMVEDISYYNAKKFFLF